MYLDEEQQHLIENWLKNPEFIAWAKGIRNEHYTEWENHFNKYPKQRNMAEYAKVLVEGIKFKPKEDTSELSHIALENLKKSLRQNDLINNNEQAKTKRLPLRKLCGIAASLFLVLSVGAYSFFQSHSDTIIIVSTDYGERKKIELSDGSIVTLNANSTLSYDKEDVRNVTLIGEAFFDIKKQPITNAPFNVKTSDLEVLVLGTEFNVNTRNEQTEVYLKEGKVNLQVDDDNHEEIEMIPGDLVTYSKKHDRLEEISDLEKEEEVESWKSGILLFSEEPIVSVLSELEEVYGIKFVIETNELEKETLSGGIPSNNLDVTLDALRDIYNLNFQKSNGQYFVSMNSKNQTLQ